MDKKEKNETREEAVKELTPEQLEQVNGGRGGVNCPRRRGGSAN